MALGLPPTEDLLDELDAIEPRIRTKTGLAILAFFLCDLTILTLLWQVAVYSITAGVPRVFVFVIAPLCAALGWLSLKSKSSLWSLLQDRKSLQARVDARLSELQGDDV